MLDVSKINWFILELSRSDNICGRKVLVKGLWHEARNLFSLSTYVAKLLSISSVSCIQNTKSMNCRFEINFWKMHFGWNSYSCGSASHQYSLQELDSVLISLQTLNYESIWLAFLHKYYWWILVGLMVFVLHLDDQIADPHKVQCLFCCTRNICSSCACRDWSGKRVHLVLKCSRHHKLKMLILGIS